MLPTIVVVAQISTVCGGRCPWSGLHVLAGDVAISILPAVPWVVIGRSCVRVEDRSSGRTPPAPGSIGDTVNIDFLSDQHDDDHERTLNIKIREGKILGNKTRIMNSCDFIRNIQGATRVLLVRLK